MRRIHVYLVIILSLCLSQIVFAQSEAKKDLEKGIKDYNDLERNTAIIHLSNAARSDELGTADQLNALSYLFASYIGENDSISAMETCKQIYALNPDHQLDDTIFDASVISTFDQYQKDVQIQIASGELMDLNMTAEDKLARAINAYEDVYLDEAIQLLSDAASKGELSRNRQLKALGYYSAIYTGKRDTVRAKEVVTRIVDIDPDFVPNKPSQADWQIAIYERLVKQIKSERVRDVILDTKPSGATVVMDGFRLKDKTPIKFDYLTQGDHYFEYDCSECMAMYETKEISRTLSGGKVTLQFVECLKKRPLWQKIGLYGVLPSVAAGVVYVLGTGDDEGNNDLPEPPDLSNSK
ncbi:MAG: hypothetical protein B6244_07225 [Candidatus Cloacimonetes bacterium 4572_55]|nr:MAG: hypothetical protein B6244_07225 [Candidatus Cloacimonetes bacterium 4572_55]